MCRSGIVYAAKVNERPLTFEVGTLWRGNIVMRDRETGSIWQQATGEALIGSLAGSLLEPLGGELTRWATWREEYPNTELAIEPPKLPSSALPPKVVAAVVKFIPPKIALPGLKANDKRLGSHEEIVGIAVGGKTRAYPMSVLEKQIIINDLIGGVSVVVFYDSKADLVRAFRREIDGRPVQIVIENDTLSDQKGSMHWTKNGETLDEAQGQKLESVIISRQWWHGWSEFYPDTEIYEAE